MKLAVVLIAGLAVAALSGCCCNRWGNCGGCCSPYGGGYAPTAYQQPYVSQQPVMGQPACTCY